MAVNLPHVNPGAPAVEPAGHALVHPKPQPGCDICPDVPCPCGVATCPGDPDHRREHAGAETTWREAA